MSDHIWCPCVCSSWCCPLQSLLTMPRCKAWTIMAISLLSCEQFFNCLSDLFAFVLCTSSMTLFCSTPCGNQPSPSFRVYLLSPCLADSSLTSPCANYECCHSVHAFYHWKWLNKAQGWATDLGFTRVHGSLCQQHPHLLSWWTWWLKLLCVWFKHQYTW